MAETIPGGAAQVNGRWVNANGEPLNDQQIKEAEKLAQQRQQERDQAEQERLLLEARDNPTARAVAQAIDASRQSAPQRRASKDEA